MLLKCFAVTITSQYISKKKKKKRKRGKLRKWLTFKKKKKKDSSLSPLQETHSIISSTQTWIFLKAPELPFGSPSSSSPTISLSSECSASGGALYSSWSSSTAPASASSGSSSSPESVTCMSYVHIMQVALYDQSLFNLKCYPRLYREGASNISTGVHHKKNVLIG